MRNVYWTPRGGLYISVKAVRRPSSDGSVPSRSLSDTSLLIRLFEGMNSFTEHITGERG
jgi:hypothetical protein